MRTKQNECRRNGIFAVKCTYETQLGVQMWRILCVVSALFATLLNICHSLFCSCILFASARSLFRSLFHALVFRERERFSTSIDQITRIQNAPFERAYIPTVRFPMAFILIVVEIPHFQPDTSNFFYILLAFGFHCNKCV